MSDRRHILLTTDVVGGVWDFCLTLAAGLRASGDEATLLAIGTPSADQRRSADGADCQLVHAPLKLEWMADAAGDVNATRSLVAEVVRDVHADVLHANQFAAACASVDVPVVLTVHSDVLSWRHWTLRASDTPAEWRPYAALVQEGVGAADEVVAVSRFLADEVRLLYAVDRRIDVIPNGWPVGGAPHAAERERATLVAGRVWDAAKNVALVAEAARGWDAGAVYLAGETAHPDGGRVEAPSPLQPLGFLPRGELDAWLDRVRIYVSAARYDPFGLLPLQAALHGCALLLSDIPSYREVWGDAACYFRSDDADDLRRQWRQLLGQPPRSSGRDRAVAHYSAERMVEAYRTLYASRAPGGDGPALRGRQHPTSGDGPARGRQPASSDTPTAGLRDRHTSGYGRAVERHGSVTA